jgi:hypothetical protein
MRWVIGLVILGCGGQTSAPSDAGSSDSFVSDQAQDRATEPDGLVEFDASQCEQDADGRCVFCSDQSWYCDGMRLPPCPSDLDAGGDCIGAFPGGNSCFTCGTNGGGYEWTCVDVNPMQGNWKLTPYPCEP